VMTASKLRIARQMFDAGNSTITEIAATIGVGRATLYRHLELQGQRVEGASAVLATPR
jgi:hypothetical protein